MSIMDSTRNCDVRIRDESRRERQSVLCQGSTYEIIAAAPPDAPLLLTFNAVATSGAVAGVEPYVTPVLLGSSYLDMPYVPSTTTQRQPQAGADPDPDVEPDLSIDVPADPALFESLTETEEKKRGQGEERRDPEEERRGGAEEDGGSTEEERRLAGREEESRSEGYRRRTEEERNPGVEEESRRNKEERRIEEAERRNA